MASSAEFKNFQDLIGREFMQHRVITDNQYCKWFSQGNLNLAEVRYFVIQFSVFSNLFLIAQLKKMLNAVNLQEMRAAKEILANEIGVIFRPKQKESETQRAHRAANSEDEGDPDLVNTSGSVDGGTFKFRAAHFEWLLKMGEPLDIGFQDMGKRAHGSASTLFFCDELERLYGNANFSIGAGASFAVEHWAAAGFWGQLVSGLKIFKAAKLPNLPLGFFTWHDRVEAQHAAHTQHELEELFFGEQAFNREEFITSGRAMLDGVAAFWDGLNQHRLEAAGRS